MHERVNIHLSLYIYISYYLSNFNPQPCCCEATVFQCKAVEIVFTQQLGVISMSAKLSLLN